MRGFGPERVTAPALCLLVALGLAGCGDQSLLPPGADVGPAPRIVAPVTGVIPTLNIAPAVGWPAGETPTAAPGLKVTAFAAGLDHPRNIHVLPNGDVLVAESAAPPKPDDSPGLVGFVMRRVMARAGAGGPSANRITLLRDTDGDGVADLRSVFLTGLNSPYGMALIGDRLYVANTDAIMRYPYRRGETAITDPGSRLTDLPGGPLNHHWTKNLVASPDGRFLYVGIGSNSNVGENGMAAEDGRAQIWQVDARTGAHRPYATGLRNPNGLAFSGPTLWTAVNERDELGSDLVPDYMTSVRDGGFYGWPYSYFGQHVDGRVTPPRPDLVAKAIVPDYALGAHTASLGLAIATDSGLPRPYRTGAFVGQHGSWNRKPLSGYKVIFVPFAGGKPAGAPRDVLTGFVNAEGEAKGRPVGVAPDGRGGLLVADDAGNTIWRVTGR
ncbi:PQQ-dependent sugar dehydrogenase [Pleomorphomonas carboxyditropha]|uniref:Sorbosone dehydrogenase n=1 Tax=Pleomorphomonas carboxyditropha TaxID=2023338 RepID=A0A2G9WRJ0_9HYPH|nr:sorbosone dehydrogenase family protein [Pleomorphomonas carboxyditropha]PIO96942.1 sorbosone dehydrogenase [Pleomorphomonas carboxyditropha]